MGRVGVSATGRARSSRAFVIRGTPSQTAASPFCCAQATARKAGAWTGSASATQGSEGTIARRLCKLRLLQKCAVHRSVPRTECATWLPADVSATTGGQGWVARSSLLVTTPSCNSRCDLASVAKCQFTHKSPNFKFKAGILGALRTSPVTQTWAQKTASQRLVDADA